MSNCAQSYGEDWSAVDYLVPQVVHLPLCGRHASGGERRWLCSLDVSTLNALTGRLSANFSLFRLFISVFKVICKQRQCIKSELIKTQMMHPQSTYIRTCVHTYIRTYVHTYIRTYVHTYIRTYVQRTTYNVQRTTYNVQRTTCILCNILNAFGCPPLVN